MRKMYMIDYESIYLYIAQMRRIKKIEMQKLRFLKYSFFCLSFRRNIEWIIKEIIEIFRRLGFSIGCFWFCSTGRLC
jgi:hypothetical protein